MVEKESDRERKRGTWPRRNSGDRMWCSEGFVFFFFTKFCHMLCGIRPALCLPVADGKIHLTQNALQCQVCLGKGPERGDHLKWPGEWRPLQSQPEHNQVTSPPPAALHGSWHPSLACPSPVCQRLPHHFLPKPLAPPSPSSATRFAVAPRPGKSWPLCSSGQNPTCPSESTLSSLSPEPAPKRPACLHWTFSNSLILAFVGFPFWSLSSFILSSYNTNDIELH